MQNTTQYHINSGYLTGEDIVNLMRSNCRDIRTLAEQMGITRARIRQVRANGVRGRNLVQDWVSAIRRTCDCPGCGQRENAR